MRALRGARVIDGKVQELLEKPKVQSLWKRGQSNPQLALACVLFIVGTLASKGDNSALAGALFGAAATLLGAWVAEFNLRRAKVLEQERKQADARRFFSPELKRVVERTLYIHQRACPNFISASVDGGTKPNDLKEDFLPEHPVLYPNAPSFGDLSPQDASSLIDFYDSLNALEHHVQNWWEREGQLPVNVFLTVLSDAERSLKLALICLDRFDIDKNFPPPYEAWGTLVSRVERTIKFADDARAAHLKRAQENKSKHAPAYGKKPGIEKL